MQIKTFLVSFFFLAVFFLSQGLYAQEAMPASGGDALGNGGTITYTLGQVFYQTLKGTNGTVSQGVQLPYEIWYSTGLKEITILLPEVYPNPASDFLILKIESLPANNLYFRLYDLNGKLLEESKIKETITELDMKNYKPAPYILKILEDKKTVREFKIIKN
jgi:hypothetical protein